MMPYMYTLTKTRGPRTRRCLTCMPVFTECNVKIEPITDKPDKVVMKNRMTRVSAVSPAERHTTRGAYSTIEEFDVVRKINAYFRKVTAQVQMTGSEFPVNHRARLVRTPKIDGPLDKVVPKLLRKHIFHTEQYPSIAGQQREGLMHNAMEKKPF